jgi:sugar phosphate isomerase/epimerase
MMNIGLWTGFGLTIENDSDNPLVRLRHTFEFLRKAGFRVCELDERNAYMLFLSADQASRKNREFVKEMKDMVDITQMHAPKPTWNLVEQQKRMEVLAQVCESFGIKVLVIHPYPCPPNLSQEIWSWNQVYRDLFDHTKNMLLQCSRVCREHGVCLAIENQIDAKGYGGRWIGGHPADIDILLQEIPDLGITIDTAHACAQQLDIPALIRHFSSRTKALHISDSTGETKDFHIGLGKGIIDWEATIKALQTTGYAGDFHLELVHEREKQMQKAEEKAKQIFEDVTSLFRELP